MPHIVEPKIIKNLLKKFQYKLKKYTYGTSVRMYASYNASSALHGFLKHHDSIILAHGPVQKNILQAVSIL